MSAPGDFRVLTVCTGNICRSRLAERLLREGFDRIAPGAFRVSSAGTRALVGAPMDSRSAEIAATHGAGDDGVTGRRLTERLLRDEEPGLVLALSREHRTAVLELAPALLHRTFTLREFARLIPLAEPGELRGGPADRWRALVSGAARRRSLAPAADPSESDVVDPYGRPEAVYRRMETELVPAVRALLAVERDAVGAA